MSLTNPNTRDYKPTPPASNASHATFNRKAAQTPSQGKAGQAKAIKSHGRGMAHPSHG